MSIHIFHYNFTASTSLFVNDKKNVSLFRKQFQKFQDKKMRINTESREVLKSAKAEGYLHEVLLDRRSKMKSDRMCKWISSIGFLQVGRVWRNRCDAKFFLIEKSRAFFVLFQIKITNRKKKKKWIFSANSCAPLTGVMNPGW